MIMINLIHQNDKQNFNRKRQVQQCEYVFILKIERKLSPLKYPFTLSIFAFYFQNNPS